MNGFNKFTRFLFAGIFILFLIGIASLAIKKKMGHPLTPITPKTQQTQTTTNTQTSASETTLPAQSTTNN